MLYRASGVSVTVSAERASVVVKRDSVCGVIVVVVVVICCPHLPYSAVICVAFGETYSAYASSTTHSHLHTQTLKHILSTYTLHL